MGGLVDSITGADKAKKASKKAAEMSRLQPFQAVTPFGSANVTETGMEVFGGPGERLAGPFAAFAQQLLGQAGAAPTGAFNLDPNSAFQMAGAVDPRAAAFGQAGQDALSALQGFDPNAFAMTQFERMNRLAAPGEETAAAETANQLFSRGRLGGGDSVSGRVFRDLDLSQALARDNRLLQAIGLAGQEQDRLAQQASGFASLGSGLQTDALQRFLGQLGGATQVGGFQNQIANSLLTRALGGVQGLNAAGQGQRTALEAALAGAGLSTNARTNAASFISGGGNAQAAARGNFAGSLIDAISPW